MTEDPVQTLEQLRRENEALRHDLARQMDIARGECERAESLLGRVAELEALINSPRTAEFLGAVRIEAAHQIERWGAEHDAGKSDADWFWLLGYLAGKALGSLKRDDRDKALHHIVTSAAVLANWHKALTRTDTGMRPGILPPDAEGDQAAAGAGALS